MHDVGSGSSRAHSTLRLDHASGPRLEWLASPAFVAGLALLLANDFLLKRAYPGAIAGKLSDFAGLCIFPMFLAALLPRHTRLLYLMTSVAWIFWKSPAASPFIDMWNAGSPLTISRVVDASDLSALAVLPLSFALIARTVPRGVSARRQIAIPILLVAAFAFMGSSRALPDECAPNCPIHQRFDGEIDRTVYEFPRRPSALRDVFNELRIDALGKNLEERKAAPFSNYYSIYLRPQSCEGLVRTEVSFDDFGDGRTNLVLHTANVPVECNESLPKPEIRRLFEQTVVNPLRASISSGGAP